MWPIKYIINEKHEITPIDNIEEWANWMGKNIGKLSGLCIVGNDTIGEVNISTVFLGIDHGFLPKDRPLIFETAIFKGDDVDIVARYHTWQEAEKNHKKIVEGMKTSVSPKNT